MERNNKNFPSRIYDYGQERGEENLMVGRGKLSPRN